MPAQPAKKKAPGAPAAPAAKSGPRTTAKPSPARTKAAAAKAAPAKKAGPAKATPAKKAGPAKKAAAAKATPAKKAPAAKKAGPAKKTAAAKKPAPAKQAAPAKKAPAAKKAGPAKKTAPATVKTEAAKKPRRSTTVICPLSGFEVKPDKPNLSPRTVERLRGLLVEERERHLHQADELLAEAEALASEREGGDTQFDEESGEGDTVNVERERDLLLSASARQIVDEIDRALERIAQHRYGLCVPAGRRISLERLEALPYADTCVDCKARAERRR